MEYLGTLFEMVKMTWSFLQSRNEKNDILERKIEELSCREIDVRAELERAKMQYGNIPKKEVELWLTNVEKIKDEVHKIKQDLGQVRWNHFRLRLSLVELVEEKIKEVAELKESGGFREGLLIDLLPGTIEAFPTTELMGETALKIFKVIDECLLDDEIGKIGVYGMGGVGKTTIMTHIHNKFKNAKIFDTVIWVKVSRDSSLEKLQYNVSKALGISLSNNKDAHCRSAELFKAFKPRGKFLLILDDMWSTFPLIKVGIPERSEENKCKIVWTTRSKKVCRGMGSERTIQVDGLINDESWTLFKEKLGGNLVLSPDIEPIAKAIVEECDGLPLAIITVGAAMKDVDEIRIWRNALEDLKNSRPELEGLEVDVFSCLRFSFDHLKTKRLQDCFLYCALHPEDDQIDCDLLVENWMADGLLFEIEDRQKGFDEGYTIINDLKDACMLENVTTNFSNRSFVKMHDLLRDLAVAITRKRPRFFVKAGFKIEQFQWDEKLMKDVVRISLMSSEIKMLSCHSKCSNLSTLLLANCRLGSIHHLFFDHMLNLRVLDLSYTSITCLPGSLSNLVKLRSLLLRNCEYLKDVPSLVKLGELRVLDLYGTAIQYFPEGMDGLTNLRLLNLCFTKKLEMFPIGKISKLSRLEELLMLGSKWKWPSNGDERGARVEETTRLTHLRKLLVEFMDSTAFSSYVRSGNWQHLKCFVITVDSVNESNDIQDALVNFCSQVRMVALSNITECMSYIVFPENTLTLSIFDCSEIEYIVSKEENHSVHSLSELWIRYLYNLRAICKEPTQDDTLANLKEIYISDCPKMKYVFLVGCSQALQNLEEIEIEDCKAMEEILVEMIDIGEANSSNNITITLPRLKSIYLYNLPKLKSISERILICSSIESICVDSCPKLKMLPLSINNTPSSLKEIKGSITWWDSLEWNNLNTKLLLQPFFSSMQDKCLYRGEEEEEEEEEDDDDDNNGVACSEHEQRGTKRKADALIEKEEHNYDDDDATSDDGEQKGTERKEDALIEKEEDDDDDINGAASDDGEQHQTERRKDALIMRLPDLNLPPLSMEQLRESEPTDLSPRTWRLWKTNE